ncbi:MAG: DNA mismatch repair endonuclease MutL [Chitinispirillia bacterium]|nr:DNA mismatch repair endonuclease MutL [Chitinispirillia bacterium]MCL2268361.1 DNA mismatch repair endonuclease MutL [Chitinispirillia bacterium]
MQEEYIDTGNSSRQNVIEVLPPSVVEKIAAGEVVERPASVLKELIENSIDAGATRVDIAVEEAGFSMMRVADNGCGMSRGDLGRSVLAHATSKIRSADDLYSIATMGFRGEALASISAVSRMSVVTSDDDSSGLGYEINVEGGISSDIAPAPRTRGTSITVRDLFFNVPARKKFMKTQRGEQAAIIKILEQLAVPFPGVHFTALVDGKKMLDLPRVGTLRERICSVAGNDFARGLVECAGEGEGMSVLAYVSTPEKLQSKPRFQSLYVNLRRIDNDSVGYAVREAFSKYLGHGNRPAFFCFLDVDPQKVDVNIHPTKQQMKFDDERGVFGFIYHAVKEGLRRSEVARKDVLGDSGSRPETNPIQEFYDGIGVGGVNPAFGGCDAGGDIQTSLNFAPTLDEMMSACPSGAGGYAGNSDNNAGGDTVIARDAGESGAVGKAWDIQCYQIHGIFVLAPIKNGILLIDQHAAHERVLYEQALLDLEGRPPVSQQLLFQIVLEMSPAEKAVLDEGRDYFTSLGFEIADFGGNSVAVSALPAFMSDGEAAAAVREMVRYLIDGRNPAAPREPVKRFAAAFACGAAIKSGQKLSEAEMNALINALFAANDPYTCPHGRPTLVRISVDELTRRFLR